MNEKNSQVLLIVGPAGSGKSTLANYIAEKLGWHYFEEDSYWVKNNFGSGLRTPEQEKLVQEQVVVDILALLKSGKNIVFEFILYKEPPNPLTEYMQKLEQNGITFNVVALKPSVGEIIERMKLRGRENDINNLETRKQDALHQLNCLEADYLKDWVIDTNDMTVDEEYEYCQKLIWSK